MPSLANASRQGVVYRQHRRQILVVQTLVCPHCAEPLETYPDPGGGEDQDYVEDCAVCCRPVRLQARYDEDAGEFRIEVSGET